MLRICVCACEPARVDVVDRALGRVYARAPMLPYAACNAYAP